MTLKQIIIALVFMGALWALFTSLHRDGIPSHRTEHPGQSLSLPDKSDALPISRVEIQGAAAGIDNDLEQPITSKIEALISCLQSKHKDVCLSDFDLILLSPEVVAEILLMKEISDVVKVDFICAILARTDPGEAPIYMDTICQLMSDEHSDNFRWFEGAISLMERDHEYWVQDFLSAITPRSIFFDDGTDLMPLLMRRLKMDSPAFDRILLEGGRGEWGGTSFQIERAFVVTMSEFSQNDPTAGLEYAWEALQSPFIDDQAGASIAQHCLFFTRILGQRNEIGPAEIEGMVEQLFSNPRFQLASATQFLADSGSGKFGGIDETLVANLRERANLIVEERQ